MQHDMQQETGFAGNNSEEEVPLGISVIGMPFQLPNTEQASRWLMELDFVDVLEGEIPQLELLAFNAPSESARLWLSGAVAARRLFELSGRPEIPEPLSVYAKSLGLSVDDLLNADEPSLTRMAEVSPEPARFWLNGLLHIRATRRKLSA